MRHLKFLLESFQLEPHEYLEELIADNLPFWIENNVSAERELLVSCSVRGDKGKINVGELR